jgi:hypothetical protein
MEIPEVRRRVRAAIDAARKSAQERRARSDQAARDYEVFLRDRAVPVFQTVAAALAAEGHRFKVATPAGSVRLSSDSSPDDYIELAFDDVSDPPLVVGRTNRGRGRRLVTAERPVADSALSIAGISDEDVLAFLVREIGPFVER